MGQGGQGGFKGDKLTCFKAGVTWCFEIDIESEVICLMGWGGGGGWASDAYKTYLDIDVYKRAETMSRITDSINKLLYTVPK